MKQRNVKIEHGNVYLYEAGLAGAAKNKKGQYIRELMEHADSLLPHGTHCTLHYQQNGAKGWAVYSYTVGDSSAHLN